MHVSAKALSSVNDNEAVIILWQKNKKQQQPFEAIKKSDMYFGSV